MRCQLPAAACWHTLRCATPWTCIIALRDPVDRHHARVHQHRAPHGSWREADSTLVRGQEWGADAAFDLYRGSLVAYSALRDPVDGFVRVFLDAEPFLAKALTCHFQARLQPMGLCGPRY